MNGSYQPWLSNRLVITGSLWLLSRKPRLNCLPFWALIHGFRLGVSVVFFLGPQMLQGQTSMTEYQVKAQFLLNFIMYVDWPEHVPSGGEAPIVIGILGQDNVGGDLQRVAEGKSINGRMIVIKQISDNEDLSGCSILFVSASESPRLDAILGKTKGRPILTVGEDDSFLDKGGIINFDLKDGKVHLEINLQAARQVSLEISSKLLSVADQVKE